MSEILVRLLNADQSVRRVAAVMIAGALVLLPIVGIAIVAQSVTARLSNLHEGRVRLAALTAIIAEGELASRALAKAESETGNELVLSADPPEVAAAGLQAWLSQIANDLGIAVASVDLVRPAPDDAAPFIGVSTNLSGRADDVMTLVARIEAANPPLFIRRIHLNATEPMRTATGAIASARGLNATIVFGGFQMRKAIEP